MSKGAKKFLFLVLLFLPCFTWFFVEVNPQRQFEFSVSKIAEFVIFETNQYYWWVLLFSIVPVLLLSFDKKVAFYKSWPTLIPAILIVGVGFILWDIAFTSWRVWGFNESYYLGKKVGDLPIEEWLFFLIIPMASIFIHECLKSYFPKDSIKTADKPISLGLGLVLLVLGLVYLNRMYTSTTFLITGISLIAHYLLFPKINRTYFYRTFSIVLIPFLIVDGALTGSFTTAPVVLYNAEEFLGIRIGSVPIEDAIYGFLMLFLILTIQHWLRQEPLTTKKV